MRVVTTATWCSNEKVKYSSLYSNKLNSMEKFSSTDASRWIIDQSLTICLELNKGKNKPIIQKKQKKTKKTKKQFVCLSDYGHFYLLNLAARILKKLCFRNLFFDISKDQCHSIKNGGTLQPCDLWPDTLIWYTTCVVNNYIVRWYRHVIVVTNIITRRTSKE